MNSEFKTLPKRSPFEAGGSVLASGPGIRDQRSISSDFLADFFSILNLVTPNLPFPSVRWRKGKRAKEELVLNGRNI